MEEGYGHRPEIDIFRPGHVWTDTDGNIIQAHGGGILYYKGRYYWYGEDKSGNTYMEPKSGCIRVDVVGVRCYSSVDLYHWKNEGLVLPANHMDEMHELHTSKVLERPKVVYNEKTHKFVMWMHVDSQDYQFARAGVAISDHPTGPFLYQGSTRPNNSDSRDMTVFKDDDGKAYLVHSSEMNSTLYISELSDDYMGFTGTFTRSFINCYREAPAIFKHRDKYYIISSGCTGWEPNEAQYAISDDILGSWSVMSNLKDFSY